MERQASTLNTPANKSHSMMNGHCESGKKRPRMDEEGSVKKKKKGEFLKGSIVRIRLHNFLTFDDIELCPGPGLNVIVGPNGTGKSSIVCGICLGLAGHPRLLGRAKELKDFVKYSKPKAFTEIELFNPSGSNPLIRREINRDKNNSIWILNGKTSQMKEVQKVVSDMNVQLSNKCQFLPQDMVVEFARMNSFQVLEETEKAVGTSDMFDLHQKLKNMKTSYKDIHKLLKEKEEMLEKKIRENQLIQNDVDRLKEREHALTCIIILREKKCWMMYETTRGEYLEVKKKSKKAESKWKKAQSDNKPLEDHLKQLDRSINSCNDEEQKSKNKLNDKQKDISRGREALNQLEDEVERPREELENKKKQERQRQNKLSRTKVEIEEMERQVAAFVPEETVKAQLAEMTEELKEIGRKLHDIQVEQQQISEQKQAQIDQQNRLHEELRKVRDVGNRRLEALRQENKSCYDIIQWLRSHQNLFQCPIIEPLILVANCKDPQYLKQVESFLNNKDKFSFIAQTKDDMTKLRREVREKLNMSVSIALDPKFLDNSIDISRFTPFADINDMRRYGFEQWMINLIDAPHPVLRVLCKYHYLHTVLVARELSPSQITGVANEIGDRARHFYSSSEDISVVVSRHGNRVKSIKRKYLDNPVYLGNMLNDSRVHQIEQQIRDIRDKIKTFDEPLSDLSQQEQKLRRDDETIRQEKTKLSTSKREKAKLISTINARKARLNELENACIDIEAEEQTCREAIMRVQHDRVQCTKKIANGFKGLVDKQKDYTTALLSHQTVIVEREGVQKRFADLRHCLEEAQAQYNEAKRLTEIAKEKAKQCLTEAQRLSGVTDPKGITAEKQQQYDSYPNDLDEIEERIHEYQTRAELSRALDAGLIEQFERRRVEIEKLQEEVDGLQAEYTGYNEQVESTKAKWLGPLKTLIAQVDQKFSSFFSNMGCAGEVSLQEDRDNDFSKYGIAIKVKFRPNEELQVLSTCRQSGGERSVSTMLYLMALQDITSCPFRAVDEINQGMDPVNERRVFNLIVSVVNKPNSSQYFLLTPKLLTDLNYTASVRVHCICNGVEMTSFQQWKIRQFLDTASAMYYDEDEEEEQ